MIKYYHYIIEEIKTGKRHEIIVKNKRPIAPAGWKIIGCCGYHEKEVRACTNQYLDIDI